MMMHPSSDHHHSTAEMLDEADSPVEDMEHGTLAIQINVRRKTGM